MRTVPRLQSGRLNLSSAGREAPLSASRGPFLSHFPGTTFPGTAFLGTAKSDVVDAVRISVVELSDKGLVNAPSVGLLRRGLYH